MSSIPYSSTAHGSSIGTVVVVDVVVEVVIVDVVVSSATVASSVSAVEHEIKTSDKKVVNIFLIAIKNTDIVGIDN
jgi:hypothetical protein